MQDVRRNFLVGLFTLVGLIVLGTMIVLFGQAPTWMIAGEAYVVNVRFDAATGIRPGTLATVGGLTIGRVRSVGFVDREHFAAGVNVAIAFEEGYRLREGSRARTSEPGLGMGRPPIEIIPGPIDTPYLASGASIPGQISPVMDSLLPPGIVSTFERTATQIGEAAAALTPVLKDAHDILKLRTPEEVDRPAGPPGNLSSAVARLDSVAKHFNTVLGDPQTQSELKQAIANFHVISEDGKAAVSDLKVASSDARAAASEIKTLVAKGQDTLTKLDDNVDRVARSTIDGLEKTGRFVERLDGLAQNLGGGQGTLGLLLNDPRLYEAMTLTFRRLAETTAEFQALVKDWQKGKIRVSL